jgi:transcriptional regulator with XRE-family HTH domain
MEQEPHNPSETVTPLGAWWKSEGEKRFGQLSAFAAALDVGRHTLRDWIAGRRDPRKTQCQKLYAITQLDYYSPQAVHDRMAAKPKKRNSNAGTAQESSHASYARQFNEWFNEQKTYATQPELARAIGASAGMVRNVMAGREFPRDELSEKLYAITGLDCFGPERDAARAEHERLIPPEVKKARRAEYLANADTRRAASRDSWKMKYDEQRQFVLAEELDILRNNPRERKKVCRECGEILRDVGPHLWPAHKMKVAEYKKRWGFLRSRNATRSEETQVKQSAAMKRGRHKPPKWTKRFLPKAQRASLKTNRPGSARLERLMEMRSRKLKPRPDHWKRDADGRIISDAKIAQFRLASVPQETIARRIGLSLTALHFRLKRMNYTGRAPAVFHGEPVGPKHFLDLCADFRLTREQAAERIGVTDDWASRRLTLDRAAEPVSFEVGKAIIELRAELKAKFSVQPASKRGGRPSQC